MRRLQTLFVHTPTNPRSPSFLRSWDPPKKLKTAIKTYTADMPSEQGVREEEVWLDLQADLAELSTNSQTLVAEKSDQSIMMDQSEIVIKAIREMLESRREAGAKSPFMTRTV